MKVLVLVPDPRSAFGLSEMLAALPRSQTRVVAFGQTTASVLPPGLDLLVYPVREGTRLPVPFLEALILHESPAALLAPAGAVRSSLLPTFLIDLDPQKPVADLAPLPGEEDQSGWLEALTADPDRRGEMLRSGLFSVELCPEAFDAPGKLNRSSANLVQARLAELTGLTVSLRSKPVSAPPSVRMVEPPAPPAASISFDHQKPPAGFHPETASPSTQPVPVTIVRKSPLDRDAGPPVLTRAELQRPTHPPASAEKPGTPGGTAAPAALGSAAQFHGRAQRGRVIVLAGLSAINQLTTEQLCSGILIATPEVLPWLQSRMGVAHFICAANSPRTFEAHEALAASHSILVHGPGVDGEAAAPWARSRIQLEDLHLSGFPELGWSDELDVGYFPAPGDPALALQWAAWLDPSEIILAGLGPLEGPPGWPAFLKGAQELLQDRGVSLVVVGRTLGSVSKDRGLGEALAG